MRILVLGAGAVGLAVAARLSGACEVMVLCRPHHAERINSHGFQLTGIWGDGLYHFPAFTEIPKDSDYDYCILSTKSQDTQGLCERYSGILANTPTLSLQNGIGNEEIITRYASHTLGGTIITGFEWRGEGAVEVTVEAGPARIGDFPSNCSTTAQRLVELFQAAGIPCEGSQDIRANIWAKTLYNCALNPLGTILNVAYGRLEAPTSWAIIEALVDEAFAVSQAEQINLPWPTAVEYLDYLKKVQLPATAEHHSSMLQDIRQGRATEIQFMNGAIARLGRQHGLSTPVNDTLIRQIAFVSGQPVVL